MMLQFWNLQHVPEPADFAVSNITTNSADFSWTAAATVEFDYGDVGHAAGDGTIIPGITTNPYTLGSLTSATSYDVFIRQDCGGGSFSAWIGPITFTTNCDVVTAPWNEDFEPTTFPPTCWTNTLSPTWIRSAAASGYGIGAASAEANFYSISSPTPFDLVSLEFDASALTSPVVRFDWAYATYPGAVDTLKVYYSTDAGTSWTELITMYDGAAGNANLNPFALSLTGGYTPLASEWSTLSLVVPANADLVKFTAVSDFGNNLYVDNVQVYQPVPNDAGTVAINVLSTIGEGTFAPQATVKNFGTATNSFDVQMTITGGYSSTQTVTALAPEATEIVTFANFTGTAGTLVHN